MNKIFLKHN